MNFGIFNDMWFCFVLGDTGGLGPQGYGQVCVCYSSEEKQWKTPQRDAGPGKPRHGGSNIDHVHLS